MTEKNTPMLSKSRFLAGLQCPLRLWHQCYSRELASAVSPAQQAIFDVGHEVGRLATACYPRGILTAEDHLHLGEAVESTLAALANPEVPAIFEAAFVHDDVSIRVDILERTGNGSWNLIEVKSATSVRNIHLHDVAIQYSVLKGSGVKVANAGVLHLNNTYIYDGIRLELSNLFTFSDLTRQVLAVQRELPTKLVEFKEMLAAPNPPQIKPSNHCLSPYVCEFWDHCTAEMPEFWIMHLTGMRRERLNELRAMGIEDIRNIPKTFPLTELQERIRRCVLNREDHIAPELKEHLTNVDYPIHFLDFETVSPAIPYYANTRPYQAIPFQWSDHVLSETGDLVHYSYLSKEHTDPREGFAKSLLETLDGKGTIFTYSNYEKRVICDLADIVPQKRKALLAILDRFKDLQSLIKKYFYTAAFRGSFSLKTVLPAVVHDMNYEKLAVREGAQASLEYVRMLRPETPVEQKKEIEQALLTYCGYDTLAMAKIRESLLERL
jgi:predicted RecB family nuclease